MRKVVIQSILVLCLCTGAVRAGVEPSPFLPQIKKLEAIEQVLLVIYENQDRILSASPETQLPPGPLTVQLKAIGFHLALEETQVVRVVTPVLTDGIAPEDIVPALEAVQTAVQGVQSRAAEGFTFPVEDPDVLEALSAVEAQAGSIVTTTGSFLPEVPCPCWNEEEIAYTTGDAGLMYEMCSLGETVPGPYYLDYMLWEGDDEYGANIGFAADSQYVDGLSGPPFRCSFGENDFIEEGSFNDPAWQVITEEEYQACAASICRQVIASPAWSWNCFGGGPYDPAVQCSMVAP